MGSKPKKWSHSEGERPHTVTVAERSRGSPIYVRVWHAGAGKYVRRSLGFRVRDDDGKLIPEAVERAKTYAMEQALKRRKGEEAIRAGEATLAQVFSLYRQEETGAKSKSGQNSDARRIEMWSRFLGGRTDPEKISKQAWKRFIQQRTSGEIDARGNRVRDEKDRRPVSNRTVEADCDWLRWVFNWATDFRPDETREATLIRKNPLTRGFKDEIPTSTSPRRPTASWDRYEAIRAKTDAVEVEVRWHDEPTTVRSHLSELLDLAVATGRRLSAIRSLRYSDLRLEKTNKAPHGAICWPADTDKTGREQTVPLNELGRRAVDRVLQERPGLGDRPLFPSPSDLGKPVSRHLADKWLREAEELAEVAPHDGSLWHAYRRMWATARKDLPAQDVAKAGGWSTVRMVEEVYMQADEETTLSVVLHEGRVREAR